MDSQMKQQIDELVSQWLSQDFDDASKQEIQQLQQNGDYTELAARMTKRIAFGTAGLRAKMAAGYACMNSLIIVQTTQGLLRYLEDKQGHDSAARKGIVIGYDGRHNSKSFADLTASVFVSQGFRVLLYSRMVPTPFVPFAVRHLGLAAGIMITASHNPKQDNGYKLYWDNGCQIIEPHDEGISAKIMQNLAVWPEVTLKNVAATLQASSLVSDPFEQINAAYFNAIKQYCYTPEKNAQAGSTVRATFTAMHGVGAPFTAQALKTFGLPDYIPTMEQIEADPEFPTVAYPNPEEGKGALKLAIATADRNNSTLILANDPDADRLAVAEKQRDGTWRIFNGNEIGLLLAHWSFTQFRAKNPQADVSKMVMVASTVSSKILRSMAQHEGFIFEETLTGFKWIGNKADDYVKRKAEGYNFIFGYEVEIGFAVGDMSLDKDGVRVAAIFYEMAHNVLASSDGSYSTLGEYLEKLYAKYGWFLMNTKYWITPTTQHLVDTMNDIRKIEQGSYPTHFGSFKVSNVRDLTTGYESAQPDHKPKLPSNAGNQMVTFTFEDNSTITLRNSGTEPKLKYYVEVSSLESKAAAQKKLDELTGALFALVDPQRRGLVLPKVE